MKKPLSLRVSDQAGIVIIQKDIDESYDDGFDNRDFHQENCFADTSIEQFDGIVIVGHAHDGKYENFDAKNFARKFKKDFVAAGHDKKEDQVKEIFAIGCELGCVVNETSYAQQLVNELYKQGFTNIAFKAVLSPPDMPEGAGMRMTFNKNTKNYSAYWIEPEDNVCLHEISERRDAIREEVSFLAKKYRTANYHEQPLINSFLRKLEKEDLNLNKEFEEILEESNSRHRFLLTNDILNELSINKRYHFNPSPMLEEQAVKESFFQQELLTVINSRVSQLEEKLQKKSLNLKSIINFINKNELHEKISVLKELRENIAQGKTGWEDIIEQCLDKKEFKKAFSFKESTTKVLLQDLVHQAREFSQGLIAEQTAENKIDKEMREARGFISKQAKEYGKYSEQYKVLTKLIYNITKAHNAAKLEPAAWQSPIDLALGSNDLLGELVRQNEGLINYLQKYTTPLNIANRDTNRDNEDLSGLRHIDTLHNRGGINETESHPREILATPRPPERSGNIKSIASRIGVAKTESSTDIQEVTLTSCPTKR